MISYCQAIIEPTNLETMSKNMLQGVYCQKILKIKRLREVWKMWVKNILETLESYLDLVWFMYIINLF